MPHLHLSVQFAIFHHTPSSGLLIIHTGTLMLLFLPAILFLKYKFAESPKFSLPLKKYYINPRILEGSVLIWSRWRWAWWNVLWTVPFLHRSSSFGRWGYILAGSWDGSSLTWVPVVVGRSPAWARVWVVWAEISVLLPTCAGTEEVLKPLNCFTSAVPGTTHLFLEYGCTAHVRNGENITQPTFKVS